MVFKSYQQGAPVAVITGAAGGMGRACSRRLGLTRRLVLADVSAEACEAEANKLRAEGFDVAAALACDISDAAAVARLATEAAKAGPLGALVHTAGLSPSMADWQAIIKVNFVGTALLLDAFAKQAVRGSVACCIASSAGHMVMPSPELEEIYDQPDAPDIMAKFEAQMFKAAEVSGRPPHSHAYGFSKRGVLRLVQDRVRDWAENGGRIVSLSPGIIYTPMGLKEAENPNTPVGKIVAMAPAGRWGTAMDIANAVHFLCSDEASFITGCDLLIDGGVTPLLTGRNTVSLQAGK